MFKQLVFLCFVIFTSNGSYAALASLDGHCTRFWGAKALYGPLIAASLIQADPLHAQTHQTLTETEREQQRAAGNPKFNANGQIETTICSAPGPSMNTAETLSQNLSKTGTIFAPTTKVTTGGAETLRMIQYGECQIAIAPLGVLEAQVQKLNLPVRPYKFMQEIERRDLILLRERNAKANNILDFTKNNVSPALVYVDEKDIDTADAIEGLKTLRDEFRPLEVKFVRGSSSEPKENIRTVMAATQGYGAWLSTTPDPYLVEHADTLYQNFQLVDLYAPGTALLEEDPFKRIIYQWPRYTELVPDQPQLYQRLRQSNPLLPEALSLLRNEQNSYTVKVSMALVGHEIWLERVQRLLQREDYQNALEMWQQALRR